MKVKTNGITISSVKFRRSFENCNVTAAYVIGIYEMQFEVSSKKELCHKLNKKKENLYFSVV